MPILKIKTIVQVEGPGSTNGDIDWRGVAWTPRTGSGVTYWIQLTDADKALWRRINTGIDSHTLAEKEQYAAKEESGWPFHVVAGGEWRQPSTTVCSKSSTEFNCVNSLGTARGFHNLETIPVLDNYDHLSVATHPHLFHRAFCTTKADVTYDTPAGIIYLLLLNPIGRIHARGDITGFWQSHAYMGKPAGPVIPPPPVRTITIPAGAKYYSAAGKIKKTDVYRFAWTAPILEATTIKLISWYRVATSEWVRGDFN